MTHNDELFDGVIGGSSLPDEYARKDLYEPQGLVVSSALDKQIARLLTLHPEVPVRFRSSNLASLDENTKQCLLEDIQTALGIVPLRNR